jgi:hypothetical protein
MPSVINEGGYGRFGAYSRVELERFFHLDDEDRRLIEARRRDYNRLGFALQVVTVRHLGMFLPDPLEVPPELVGYLAEQLAIEDPTCVKRYTDPGENQARTRLGDPARVWSDTVRRGRAATGREAADRRLWQQLTSGLTPQTSSALLRLLDVPDGGRQRVNELDRLRKP